MIILSYPYVLQCDTCHKNRNEWLCHKMTSVWCPLVSLICSISGCYFIEIMSRLVDGTFDRRLWAQESQHHVTIFDNILSPQLNLSAIV